MLVETFILLMHTAKNRFYFPVIFLFLKCLSFSGSPQHFKGQRLKLHGFVYTSRSVNQDYLFSLFFFFYKSCTNSHSHWWCQCSPFSTCLPALVILSLVRTVILTMVRHLIVILICIFLMAIFRVLVAIFQGIHPFWIFSMFLAYDVKNFWVWHSTVCVVLLLLTVI